jgi:hypothetical protein
MRRGGPLAAIVWLATTLAGCGGDGDEGSPTCHLVAETTGAIGWSFSGDPACLIPFGGSEGIWMWFAPIEPDGESEIAAFVINVLEVGPGETGTFPAAVEIHARDERTWETPGTCTVQIDEHVFEQEEELGAAYRATGSGQCVDAAMPGGEGDPIEVAPFEFRFPPRWPSMAQ